MKPTFEFSGTNPEPHRNIAGFRKNTTVLLDVSTKAKDAGILYPTFISEPIFTRYLTGSLAASRMEALFATTRQLRASGTHQPGSLAMVVFFPIPESWKDQKGWFLHADHKGIQLCRPGPHIRISLESNAYGYWILVSG